MNQWRLRAKVLSVETKQYETNVYGKVHLQWNPYKDRLVEGTFTASGAMVYVMKEKVNSTIDVFGEFRANEGREGGWFLSAEIKGYDPIPTPQKEQTGSQPATDPLLPPEQSSPPGTGEDEGDIPF